MSSNKTNNEYTTERMNDNCGVSYPFKAIMNDEIKYYIIKKNPLSKEAYVKQTLQRMILNAHRTKQSIPTSLKIACWNWYFSEEVGKAKCACCNIQNITQHNFHCGYIIPGAYGGKLVLENLRPVCATCKSSWTQLEESWIMEHVNEPFDC